MKPWTGLEPGEVQEFMLLYFDEMKKQIQPVSHQFVKRDALLDIQRAAMNCTWALNDLALKIKLDQTRSYLSARVSAGIYEKQNLGNMPIFGIRVEVDPRTRPQLRLAAVYFDRQVYRFVISNGYGPICAGSTKIWKQFRTRLGECSNVASMK